MNVLGIIGIILLCILALPAILIFLLLLLCCFKTGIRAKVTPDRKEIWISHAFLKKKVYPLPPKREKPQEENKPKKADKVSKPSEKKEGGMGDAVMARIKALTLPDYIDFIRMFKDGFIGRIMFEKLFLQIKVGTPSADLTAQRYGQLTAAVFPLLGKLDAAGRIKDGRVNISPDFLCEEMEITADVNVSFRIIHLFSWAIKVVFKIITKKLS